MVVIQATKLTLPQSSSSLSSPQISSLLFDPHSLSLALMHSDSSFSLFPSLSLPPLSLSSLPPPQTLIPPPSSSATFLRLLNPNPNSPPRLLFISSSPLRGGSSLLLRFWILLPNSHSFSKARVICNQTGLKFDDHKSGVVFSVNHGISIKLVGSINVFAMYSVSNCKIWVFAAKMVDEDDNGVVVKLIKCAVIDCSVPVFAISVSFGFLILGEENGVRVFPLRPLVKGRVKEHRRESKNLNDGLTKDKLEAQRLNLPNGVIQRVNGTDVSNSDSVLRVNYGASGRGSKRSGDEDTLEISSLKLKSVKLRRDSKEGGSFFVAFKSKEVEGYKSTKSAKAISIQALSPNKFVILDSTGELQLLCLSNPVLVSEIRCHVKQLTTSMKVEKLAILPDISTRTQTVWISDGRHTVHMLAVPDIDASFCESDGKDIEEKLIQISVLQAIFASETIQDIIPLASNAILILGQVEGIRGSEVYVTELVAFDFLIPMVLFVIISHVMSCGCLRGHRALAEK
ncbi:hypothetical protein HYC85_002592 [Camellia sinensis]|uniref:Cleavage/polyadenylation specificity factor A subunit N-terminal domain-containing protein n=1 Tax=Camellia sinensis TaxID=4442 RepID=A0A7J7I8Q1_CAMSI|nr:hypothetical protein HYC85_002592 [Camellia sinensis]